MNISTDEFVIQVGKILVTLQISERDQNRILLAIPKMNDVDRKELMDTLIKHLDKLRQIRKVELRRIQMKNIKNSEAMETEKEEKELKAIESEINAL